MGKEIAKKAPSCSVYGYQDMIDGTYMIASLNVTISLAWTQKKDLDLTGIEAFELADLIGNAFDLVDDKFDWTCDAFNLVDDAFDQADNTFDWAGDMFDWT
eukprot:13699009-Ditylum_brightwellii.AAC.1